MPVETRGATQTGSARPISLSDYHSEIKRLHALVDACANTLSESVCHPSLVGSDAVVSTPSGGRKIQYQWLRAVLGAARTAVATRDEEKLKKVKEELELAGNRLDKELALVQAGNPGSRNVAAERQILNTILAKGNYATVHPPTLSERMSQAFLQWLERHLRFVGASGMSQALVSLFMITLILIVCGGLVWWFGRRIRSQQHLPTGAARHTSAASSQDWKQWLEQGHQFAREQQWRLALHHVYWSAISYLESRRLWPADRARTPREYLSLIASAPEYRNELFPLTHSFERTWYGNEAADQLKFDEACMLLERLAAR